MERYSIFLGRKNQYCEKYYITKCSLQIQCDSYQITNGIFHKTKTKNFTIRVETQKTLNSQRSLKKKEWSWRNQHSWPQIILQNYSHQYSMILAPKQKYRPMEQDRKPRNKEARIYSGVKTASSIKGAGKIGQLHVQFSRSVMCNSANPWTATFQASLSITNSWSPPNSCPLSRWWHPAISSSVIPFSSCLQSFPASGSFQMSQLFASGGQSIGASASTSVLPMNTQDWSPLGWTEGSYAALIGFEISKIYMVKP